MNLFSLPRPLPPDELCEIVAQGKTVRVERIVSAGQSSDWYDQEQSELVVLLQGRAVIEYTEGESATLERGDSLLIPPHCRHRVSFTSREPPCVWLCVFFDA